MNNLSFEIAPGERLRERVDGEAIRFWILGTHYRSPLAFDLPSLGGRLALDIKGGQFLQMEPGAARLLGVAHRLQQATDWHRRSPAGV